jgi:hypothetical protein
LTIGNEIGIAAVAARAGRFLVGYFLLRALVALFLIFPALQAQASVEGAVVEWQRISVTLEPENHLLIGESTTGFAAGVKSVSLRLSDSARIDFVSVSGSRVPYTFTGGVISLELPSSREALSVKVSYRASFNDTVSQHPAASEDPSYGVNGIIAREGTFLGDGAYWYPVPEQTPLHRSLSVVAPAGTEAVTAGRRASRKTIGAVTRSVWEEEHPVGVLSLCAGPYRIEERRVDGIDLYTYFYPDNVSLAPRYLDAAAKYLKFYTELFGRYPFEKFAVVENFFPTGYGMPSFTLLGGSVIRLPFIIDTSFPHEIAHSWWGNGIGVDLREGNWCEGLVSYLADYLLKERRSPAEAHDYRRQLLIDYASLVTPASDFPLRAFVSRSDPASRAIGYGKGAMVFHMVRCLIGDRAFFEALRQLCRDHLYRQASWSDLVRAFSRSSGRDLSSFMQQWLVRPGGPRLSLAEVSSRHDAHGWTVSGTVVQSAPPFDFGLPLRLETAGTQVTETLAVHGERTPFTIRTAEAPGRLLLDPDANVFRILSPGEIPATVNSLKGSSSLIGVRTKNCQASAETFQALLASLSQGEAAIVDEDRLDRQKSARSDLLFCGIPRDRSLLPKLPDGVDLAEARFSVEGGSFPAPDALLMLVMRRPGSSDRVTALFQPLSEAAAARYAPKITHYGKYGYLAFAGGENRRKGTMAAPGEGVVVDLRP